MSSQGGDFQQITEETQRIIEQIQNQLDSQTASQPDGQPLQVAYQIIHDDDNQQVLEIQYHQVMEVIEQTEIHSKDRQSMLHVALDASQPSESNLPTQLSRSQVKLFSSWPYVFLTKDKC